MDDLAPLLNTSLGVKEAEAAVAAATGAVAPACLMGVVMIKREQLRTFANVYYTMKGRIEDLLNKQITTGAVNMTRPSEGSIWEHYGGGIYTVLFVTNDNPNEVPKKQYPATVVYQNVTNGKRYSGPLDDWHRRMTLVHVNSLIADTRNA